MKLSPELRRQLGAMVLMHIRDKYKTQSAAAVAWSVHPPFVSRVIAGERPPTNAMLRDAGIELVAIYRPLRSGQTA